MYGIKSKHLNTSYTTTYLKTKKEVTKNDANKTTTRPNIH